MSVAGVIFHPLLLALQAADIEPTRRYYDA
jgi:hypothetical protein